MYVREPLLDSVYLPLIIERIVFFPAKSPISFRVSLNIIDIRESVYDVGACQHVHLILTITITFTALCMHLPLCSSFFPSL